MSDFESSSMRVSDADRESAMTALGEHMSTGRLTVDEYGDRAARVSTAKTRRDVLELFDDLPAPRPDFTGTGQAAPTPVQPMPASTPSVRSRGGVGWAMAAAVPVSWVAAFAVALITGYWAIFLLPFVLTIIGAAMLGRGVHRMGKRMIGNITQTTGFSGWNSDWSGSRDRDGDWADGREAKWERHSERWERHADRYAQQWQRRAERWQRDGTRRQGQILGQLGAQIGAEVERGMREAYRRNRRHHGRRHHW